MRWRGQAQGWRTDAHTDRQARHSQRPKLASCKNWQMPNDSNTKWCQLCCHWRRYSPRKIIWSAKRDLLENMKAVAPIGRLHSQKVTQASIMWLSGRSADLMMVPSFAMAEGGTTISVHVLVVASANPWRRKIPLRALIQYKDVHCGDKTVVRSSYLHNEISHTSKMLSLYWIGAEVPIPYIDTGPIFRFRT